MFNSPPTIHGSHHAVSNSQFRGKQSRSHGPSLSLFPSARAVGRGSARSNAFQPREVRRFRGKENRPIGESSSMRSSGKGRAAWRRRRCARTSRGVVTGPICSTGGSDAFFQLTESLSQTVPLEGIADLLLVDPWQGHEKTDIGHVLKTARGIVLHGEHLHGRQMLWLGHENLAPGGPWEPFGGLEQTMAGLLVHINEIDPRKRRIGVHVVGVARGLVQGCVAQSFEEGNDVRSRGSFDHDVEIERAPRQSIRSERKSACQSMSVPLRGEKGRDRLSLTCELDGSSPKEV